jgi:hypothetical protein
MVRSLNTVLGEAFTETAVLPAPAATVKPFTVTPVELLMLMPLTVTAPAALIT